MLDTFTAKYPGHAEASAFKTQAGVYLWAKARTWLQAFRTNPTETDARARAVADLNASLERLKPVYEASQASSDVFAQNARFRTAQALADLAEVGPDDDATRRAANAQALTALERPITEPSLKGFAELLRGSLLARLGKLDDAQAAVLSAWKATPPPPEAELVEAWLEVMLAKADYVAAG